MRTSGRLPAAHESGETLAVIGVILPADDRTEALVRRGRLLALGLGGLLLPWSVLLGVVLPASTQAHNWSLAWAGLDGAEAIAALATGALLARADSRASLTSAAAGVLLLVDAWFDVCTSAPGLGQVLAVSEAILAELPLSAAAIWLAVSLIRDSR